MIINTTEGAEAIADSFSIRSSALVNNVPHYTTVTGAAAAVSAIHSRKSAQGLKHNELEVASLQSYAITSS